MKALVELDGPRSQPFQAFAEQRAKWELHDMYRAPGTLSADGSVLVDVSLGSF